LKKSKKLEIIIFIGYLIFIVYAIIFKNDFGLKVATFGFNFSKNLFLLLPLSFILIGLFKVWVKREKIEQYFGHSSGLKGHFFAIILATTTVGGIFVAFPVGKALIDKGARLSVILTYLGAAAVVRIPMTTFEATFVGIKFSIIRLLFTIPLIIISSEIIAFLLNMTHHKRETS